MICECVQKEKMHTEDVPSAKGTKNHQNQTPRKKIKDNCKQNHYIQEDLPRSR